MAAIVQAEGWRLNREKTQCLGAHQRQVVTGIVVNQYQVIARKEFDNLKACLHQAALHGPASQNKENAPHFKAVLTGRIAWVKAVNPAKAAKLQKWFDRIRWPSEDALSPS